MRSLYSPWLRAAYYAAAAVEVHEGAVALNAAITARVRVMQIRSRVVSVHKQHLLKLTPKLTPDRRPAKTLCSISQTSVMGKRLCRPPPAAAARLLGRGKRRQEKRPLYLSVRTELSDVAKAFFRRHPPPLSRLYHGPLIKPTPTPRTRSLNFLYSLSNALFSSSCLSLSLSSWAQASEYPAVVRLLLR